MKLYIYVFLLFVQLMALNAMLSFGDYVISALGPTFRISWDISYIYLVGIYCIPMIVGFVSVYASGKSISLYNMSPTVLIWISTVFIIMGLVGMFSSVLIPNWIAQAIIFFGSRIAYICGFLPMAVHIDYMMSQCYRYYTGYKHMIMDIERGERDWIIPVTFGMIGVLQTCSDYGGRMLADVVLPYMSTFSMKIAMSTLLLVSAMFVLVVWLTIWLFRSMEKSVVVQKINTLEGNALDFNDFLKKEYSIHYLKVIGVIMLLNFVWVGAWNGFLLLMPQIWLDLFVIDAVNAPVYVGIGLAIACIVSMLFCVLSDSIGTIRFFAVIYWTALIPGCLGMIFSVYYPWPLMTAACVATAGSLTTFITMILVPIMFSVQDYAMVFVWLEISRGLATLVMPFFFGLVFTSDNGTFIVVMLFIALSVAGFLIFSVVYGMIERNRHRAKGMSDPIQVSSSVLDMSATHSSSDDIDATFESYNGDD